MLNANDNEKIKDITHLKKLKILFANGRCGITDDNLNCHELVVLGASNNEKIRNIKHLKKLKVLYAKGNCGITDEEIKELDFMYLVSDGNNKITIRKERPYFMCNMEYYKANFLDM